MQSLLDSMTPGQRRELQEMMQSLLAQDERLEAELAQLAMNLDRAHAASTSCAGATTSGATTSSTLREAMQLMEELPADGRAGAPAPKRARDPQGPRGDRPREAASGSWASRPPSELEQLAEIYQEARGGGLPRAPGRPARADRARAIRKIGDKALRDIFAAPQARPLRPPRGGPARARAATAPTRPSPTSSATRSCSTCGRR